MPGVFLVYNKNVFLLLARTTRVSAAWVVWVNNRNPLLRGLLQRILLTMKEKRISLIIQQVFYV